MTLHLRLVACSFAIAMLTACSSSNDDNSTSLNDDSVSAPAVNPALNDQQDSDQQDSGVPIDQTAEPTEDENTPASNGMGIANPYVPSSAGLPEPVIPELVKSILKHQ